jgi:hypothetical protein
LWDIAIDEIINAAILFLSEELREMVREKGKKRGRNCMNWIACRDSGENQTDFFVNYLVKIRKSIENT